jgi:alkanesulfonate monooxygenase SsuD/methylene tetrahydromethanopterin reductase-like flavin-dependent oxidoreductase (luciferase family)
MSGIGGGAARPVYRKRDDLPFSLGLDMPFGEGHMDGGTPRWSDLLAMAKAAEEVGFDVVWVSDHMGFESDAGEWEGCWEALTVTAALAAATSRVQLGNYVLAMPYRNPALLAKMAETLDEISGGRFILGLGAGWNKPEFDRFDFPWDGRFDRFDDGMRIICSLLREGTADHDGKVVSARGAEIRPRGPRPEGLPVVTGAHGPRTMRLSAELADGWDGGSGNLEEAKEILARMDEACRSVGRDPTTLERSLEAFVRTVPASDGKPPRERELTGSPDELAGSLLRYADLRIQHLVITVLPLTVDGVREFGPVIESMKASRADSPRTASFEGSRLSR